MSDKRTMRGKVVGSVRPPMEKWFCYPLGAGWVVCAPSGARMTEWETEEEALDEVARRNEEDDGR